ncbi:hypothetical protein ACLJYM_10780 [Rhizobium giardinii]|uniref:hypothetical protein n=1 Tax=Rhizobium giardinii TaxID=56731 RepID=UPI0039E1741F
MSANAAQNFNEEVPDHVGEPSQPRKSRWVTNDGAEFLNSLCPNSQAFPAFDWCTSTERLLLEEACADAFNVIGMSWDRSIFTRIDPKNLTVTEHRILAVIELKTLRFNKLVDKIPRKTFVRGDERADKYGFEIVPKSGLSDGKLTDSIRSLKKKRSIGCVKADQYNGRDASNIYCVLPIRELLARFYRYAVDALSISFEKYNLSATRCTELEKHLKAELLTRCGDILREDDGHANGA